MPPDPWPGTSGGAYSPFWGGDIKLYVWAAILAGTTMKWGPHAVAKLDSGNVWGKGSSLRSAPPAPAGRLWIDLSCDVQRVETSVGGSRADGAIAQGDAGTCSLRLADPDRAYDPSYPDSPYQYGGQSRLSPGTTVLVFAEVWDGTAITQEVLFTGTVDSWSEDWELHPDKRVAQVQASDAVKDLVNRDYGEQPAVGAGETVSQRISRILTYYGWAGPSSLDTSTITLQATTLAKSAWELIGRATEDELGFSFIDQTGTLRFKNRDSWTISLPPAVELGCYPGSDTVTDAQVEAASLNIRNAVYASIVGGTTQVATSTTSIDRYGVHSYKRTDLGLQTDGAAAQWASVLVSLQATPRPRLSSVTVIPRFDPALWIPLLALRLITDGVMVRWTPPDQETTTEVTGRALGVSHTVSRDRWEVDLELILADIFLSVMHWGPDPKDKLSSGNTYR
jgi:hypothetical protein